MSAPTDARGINALLQQSVTSNRLAANALGRVLATPWWRPFLAEKRHAHAKVLVSRANDADRSLTRALLAYWIRTAPAHIDGSTVDCATESAEASG